MDLSTNYLGCQLPHPFMPGASAMSESLDLLQQFEDAGAAAVVLHSLFEEQIIGESLATISAMERPSESHAEALSYLPTPAEFRLGPDQYLEHLQKAKAALGVPVIASLNGSSLGGWLDYAKQIQQAGADAMELNVYYIATELNASGKVIEQQTIEMLRTVKNSVSIPVAVKLSPFYTSMSQFAHQLGEAGADGLVLFNRFYQPDIDIAELEVKRELHLSDSSELLLRLRWLAILSGRVAPSLAVSGGVHTAVDAIKAVMCGAHAVQMVSALILNGPQHLTAVKQQVTDWLEVNEYESLAQMQGSMSLLKSPDPAAFERGNYMKILKGYRL